MKLIYPSSKLAFDQFKRVFKTLNKCINAAVKSIIVMAVFMLKTLKLSETLKLSRDDFNVWYKNCNLVRQL